MDMSFILEAGTSIIFGLHCAMVSPFSVRMQIPTNACESAGSAVMMLSVEAMSSGLLAVSCARAGVKSITASKILMNLLRYVLMILRFVADIVAKIIKIAKFARL